MNKWRKFLWKTNLWTAKRSANWPVNKQKQF